MSHPYYFELRWWSLVFAKVEGSFDLFGLIGIIYSGMNQKRFL